jgi:manganese transport protein
VGGTIQNNVPEQNVAWWRSLGPALITACVVFGPGSLVISANVGATHGYELLWVLLLTGIFMGVFTTMSARIAVVTGQSHFNTLRQETGRTFALVMGAVLCFTCGSFQFSNNIAIALIAGSLVPEEYILHAEILSMGILNLVLILFLFRGKQLYHILEKMIKVMVGVVLLSFVINLFLARPNLIAIFRGFIPSRPEGLSLGIPRIEDGAIVDPLILIASLFGTTFSVAGAFFQGNLVYEKGWTKGDYDRGVIDSITGIGVLTFISLMIMVTAATVIPGQPANNIAALAGTMKPLLGPMAFAIFCIGLLPVALNPFLINAMIGGTALADGAGLPGKMGDFWPRMFTILVLSGGFIMAAIGLWKKIPPVNLMIFGQALTVVGNPLMAGTLLWLANKHKLLGKHRNRLLTNLFGCVGLLIVLLLALRVLWNLYLRFTII